MMAVYFPLLWLACHPGDGPASGLGFLYPPAYSYDDPCGGPLQPYRPQPGDIILTTDRSSIIRAGHWLVGCQGVHHSALVFARPDGSPAVLEAGPFNNLWVETLDPWYLLTNHEERG